MPNMIGGMPNYSGSPQMWPQQPTNQFPLNPGMGGPIQGQQQPGQLPQMGQFPPNQMTPGGTGLQMGQMPMQGQNPSYQMQSGMMPQMQAWGQPHQQFAPFQQRQQRPQFGHYG